MDRIILVKDTKGYYCSKCRQRFSNIINVEQIRCQSCERVSISSSSSPSSSPINRFGNKGTSRVSSFAENFKNHIQLRCYHHHHNQESDSDKSSSSKPSLNSIASSLKFSSPSEGQRKRALLIGVTYKKWKHKLKGTVNDVKNMKNVLIDTFGFLDQNILVLIDEEQEDPELIPTKKGIEKALQWLVQGCRSGDSLVFYFAGHGSQEKDTDSDEIDGLDETICPLDFEVKGKILDDYINSVIVRPLVAGVTLHAIIDSCHSATMLDLPYVCNAKEKEWVNIKTPSGPNKDTSGGLAICISACRDDQKVVDSSALCGKGTLTYNLIQEIKKSPGLTYGDLITSVQNNIDKAIEAPGIKAWFLRTFFRNAFLQDVQLSSSEKFDIYKKEFKL